MSLDKNEHNHTLGHQEQCRKIVLLFPFELELLQSVTAPSPRSGDMAVARAHLGINEDKIGTLGWSNQCLLVATTQHSPFNDRLQ